MGKYTKNVHNLRKSHCINSAHLSTTAAHKVKYVQEAGYIHLQIHIVFTQFHRLYTHLKNTFSPQLNTPLYTVSTAPTITKTKEK